MASIFEGQPLNLGSRYINICIYTLHALIYDVFDVFDVFDVYDAYDMMYMHAEIQLTSNQQFFRTSPNFSDFRCNFRASAAALLSLQRRSIPSSFVFLRVISTQDTLNGMSLNESKNDTICTLN